MRSEVFQCDTCNKEHSVIVIAPIPPRGWYALAGMGDTFEKDLHFCSLHCLGDWVEKQFPAVEEVKTMSEMFPDAFNVIDPPHLAATEFKVTDEDRERWRDL